MLDFAYLDNQDIVPGIGNLQSLVTFGLNKTTQSNYRFKLEPKLNVKTIGNFTMLNQLNKNFKDCLLY